jgi:type I restriction enzyme, S subunit
MKNEPATLTPELRFPEFEHGPAWERRTVGAVCDLAAGDFVPPSEIAEQAQAGMYPCYGGNGLRGYVRSFTHEGPYVLVGRQGALCGNVNLFAGKFHATEHALVAKPTEGTDTRWLSYALELLDLNRFSTGQAQPGLSVGVLNDVPILVPNGEAEQRKIAACLTSLDRWIAAEERKLGALRTGKKGLMRQLFPKEGMTRPRLRFPEFRDSGEWKTATLGDIAEIKLGKMLDAKKHTTGRLLPYLNNISVRWNEVDTSNLQQMYFDDDELERYGLKQNDVVVCEGGEPGRAAVWDGRVTDLKFQKAIHRVRFNVPFEPYLLVAYLQAIAGTKQLERFFTGGGIKHLTRQSFAQLPVPIMPLPEQRRVAACLLALDSLLAAQSRKLATLGRQKKGLMHRLFPASEAGYA